MGFKNNNKTVFNLLVTRNMLTQNPREALKDQLPVGIKGEGLEGVEVYINWCLKHQNGCFEINICNVC